MQLQHIFRITFLETIFFERDIIIVNMGVYSLFKFVHVNIFKRSLSTVFNKHMYLSRFNNIDDINMYKTLDRYRMYERK